MTERDINIGFHFNKDYYLGFQYGRRAEDTYTEPFFRKKNEVLTNLQFAGNNTRPGESEFDLKTTYPGLVVGLGYGHGVKAVGEFKLGFSFDFTSGLPVIPGSSVKGTLRSYFPNVTLHKNSSPEEKTGKVDYIRYVFFKAGLPEAIAGKLDVTALELEIFEGKSGSKQLGTYARDVFNDAVIVAGNSRGKIFGDDSITPHTDGPLKDPKPLLFLKILPNVTFRFSMELKDSLIEPAITAQMKGEVFINILKTMGIGAKTNVGYGQLIDSNL